MIKEFQKENPTAMIGDGLNDAPALATADIGISMGISGSALATESGDIVLMTNDIQRVPKALRIAKQVRRKIIENVILSISTKAAIVGLAIAGHPLVWAAVLSDVGTCLLVIFNSMLLLRGTSSCESSTKHSHTHKHKHKHNSGCSSSKCSSSTKEHGHSHSCSGDRVKDDECCGKGDHDVESQKPHNHGCCSSGSNSSSSSSSCGGKKCSSSVNEHGHTVHCHPHPHSEDTVENGVVHRHDHCGSSSGSCKHGHKHQVEEEHEHEHENAGCSDHKSSCAEAVESHNCESQERQKCEHHDHTKHEEDSSEVCRASKKTQRGCCESFRRECCIRNGSNFRGGLSEIVID